MVRRLMFKIEKYTEIMQCHFAYSTESFRFRTENYVVI